VAGLVAGAVALNGSRLRRHRCALRARVRGFLGREPAGGG